MKIAVLNKRQFARQVHMKRWEKGWTLEDLARETGIDKTRLWRIENGHAKVEVGEFMSLCLVLRLVSMSVEGLDELGVEWSWSENTPLI